MLTLYACELQNSLPPFTVTWHNNPADEHLKQPRNHMTNKLNQSYVVYK